MCKVGVLVVTPGNEVLRTLFIFVALSSATGTEITEFPKLLLVFKNTKTHSM